MRLCRKFPLPSHPLGTSAPLPWQRTSPLPSPLCPCSPPPSLVTAACQHPASTAGSPRRAAAQGHVGSATSSHQRTTFQWLDGATAKTYYCTPVVATTVITTRGGGKNLPRPAGSPPSACTRADPRRPVSIVVGFFWGSSTPTAAVLVGRHPVGPRTTRGHARARCRTGCSCVARGL